MNIKYKLTTAAVTGAMMAAIVAPSAFAKVTIKNNGAGSVNGAVIVKASKSKVKQTNNTVVGTSVTSISNTGGNSANGNVGGGNTIITGNNTTKTTVDVEGGTNTNEAVDCCCGTEGTDVVINHNGAGSFNGVLAVNLCKNSVKQTNNTVVFTHVTSISNTGGNSTNGNVGGGNSTTTGNNSTTTDVTVGGSTNSN